MTGSISPTSATTNSSIQLKPSLPSSSILPSSSTPTVTNTHSMVTRSKNGIQKPQKHYGFTAINALPAPSIQEPYHFSEAIKHDVWKQAMNEEFDALLKQGTWTLVPCPSHANVIGCQWIHKIKRNSDGSIARYKARLVANGNQQYEGIDFSETFSPVIKQPTIRIVLSLAVTNHWVIKQLDVSNAFLHGVIDEDVYMKQPMGYKSSAYPTRV